MKPVLPQDMTWSQKTGKSLSMRDLKKRVRAPDGQFSIRDWVNARTAQAIMANGLDAGTTTIRCTANDVVDLLEKSGRASRAQTDRLSQKVTIREVKKLLRRAGYDC
jgi:hypothetical protein